LSESLGTRALISKYLLFILFLKNSSYYLLYNTKDLPRLPILLFQAQKEIRK
jgi:hypothetical protein